MGELDNCQSGNPHLNMVPEKMVVVNQATYYDTSTTHGLTTQCQASLVIHLGNCDPHCSLPQNVCGGCKGR